MLKINRIRICLLAVNLLVLTSLASAVYGDSILGPALTEFAVLGHTTVTNVPSSTIAGDVGVSPGAAITGSGGIVFTSGTLQANTALAQQAQNELVNAILNTGPGIMTP